MTSLQDQMIYKAIADNYNKDNLSIPALKANLFYADALKQKAFEAHKEALINYHQALTALNEAIVKGCYRG